MYNEGQIFTREAFILELALLVSCHITEWSMSMNQVELDRHHELAAFLRSRRARVSPEQVGLPRGTRSGPRAYDGEKCEP